MSSNGSNFAIFQLLVHAIRIQNTNVTADFKRYEIQNDPTFFGEICQRYQAGVEFLLSQDESTASCGITQEQIDHFRSIYEVSGFACRYRHCPRSINGFISMKERKAHEVLHIRLLRCADAACEFYPRGFTTKNALQRHNQRYHTKPDDNEIPIFRPLIYQNSTAPQLPDQASINDSCATDADKPQAAHTYIPSMAFGTADLLKPSRREFPESSLEPFLITPEQIMTLPHLSDDEKNRYAREAKECWDYIKTLPPSEHHTTVKQSLANFTKKTRRDLEDYSKANLDIDDIGDSLFKLDIRSLPEYHVKTGPDWVVIFNPKVLRVLDVDIKTTLEFDDLVSCLGFSPDGKLLATGSKESASIFNVTTSRLVCKLPHASPRSGGSDEGYVRAICFAPCGNRVVTGAEDALVRIWDIGQQTIICTLHGHEDCVYGIDWKDKVIVSGGGDRRICLWDPVSQNCTLILSMGDIVSCVSLSPSSQWVVAGSYGGSIGMWRCSDGHAVDGFKDSGTHAHVDGVYSVAYSPNGKHVASASLDTMTKIWRSSESFNDRRCVRKLQGHSDFVLDTTFTLDGAWLLSSSKDNGVQLWDAETGCAQFRLEGHRNSGNCPTAH